MNRMSIKWKLLLVCVLLVTVPTVTMGIFGYRTHKEYAQRNMEDNLRQIARDWQKIARAYIEQVDRVLKREEVLVQHRLRSVSTGIVNVLEALAETSPGSSLEDIAPTVSRVIEDLAIGHGGYVFIMGIDFSCWICPDEGGHPLGAPHSPGPGKVISERLNGRLDDLKSGEVIVVPHAWHDRELDVERRAYIAFSYSPAWDLLIGSLVHESDYRSYELKAKLQNELRYKIAEQRIGNGGYIAVINTKGEYVVSKDRFRDGENVLDTIASDGSYPIRESISLGSKLKDDETAVHYYLWRNLGEKEARQRLIAVAYVSEWDWIIGVSAYFDEFLQGLEVIKRNILAVCVVFILLGSVAAYLLAALIARPIRHLQDVSARAANGNFEVSIAAKLLERTDELGGLASSFSVMIANLRELIAVKDAAARQLSAKNARLARTQNELRQEKELLQKLALTDPLTDLYNRRAFFGLARAKIKHSRRTGEPISIAMFDIDSFKRINDTHGHDKGDIVLKSLAQFMKKNLRADDVYGRIGGEEFAVLSSGALQGAFLAMERFRKGVEALRVDIGGEQVGFTVSIGVVEIAFKSESLEQAMIMADSMLYQAKEGGRNRVVCDDSMV